ncbi:hypothetical protein [Leptospira paudalimensis]|uniref:Uncharacterized protein n=1 Tax=Leptospira paudalimensis TaxID=2950024 RepID=A0ABT3M5A8_9LEPT|nr:hypothetical protein [Leptospira paudalimensis]MCW7503579.1 hypothetical protein [Leptospira paudalimensis]
MLTVEKFQNFCSQTLSELKEKSKQFIESNLYKAFIKSLDYSILTNIISNGLPFYLSFFILSFVKKWSGLELFVIDGGLFLYSISLLTGSLYAVNEGQKISNWFFRFVKNISYILLLFCSLGYGIPKIEENFDLKFATMTATILTGIAFFISAYIQFSLTYYKPDIHGSREEALSKLSHDFSRLGD